MSFFLSSRAKRVGIALTFVIMLPALTGCVYLRLLHFKNQLKSFDENVSVLKGKELAFEFSKPIVKNSDFVFLTGSQPSRIDFADSSRRQRGVDMAFPETNEQRFGQAIPNDLPSPLPR